MAKDARQIKPSRIIICTIDVVEKVQEEYERALLASTMSETPTTEADQWLLRMMRERLAMAEDGHDRTMELMNP